MRISKCLMMAALMGVAFAGSACNDQAVDDTKKGASSALDATKAGTDKAIDATKKASDEAAVATKDMAQRTAEKTKEIAGEVVEKSREVANATAAAMTDGWITAKVKAKFADDVGLKGSDINVDTSDHVVTLKGTVPSGTAKARAEDIARGTEQVKRVSNQLVVK